MSQQQERVFNGRYEVVRHVARGGMAEVYLAHDLLLDRPVALKVLFPELSIDRAFVERFRREAQAAANLSHPNIVSVYDWGEEGSTYFIVMEYIDGRPLSQILRTDGPLLPDRAAAIAADVAAALAFAHRNGVIHRDVKPGNVLITNDGLVKVTDFGIARAANTEENLTQTGAVMGTATYFSPEQAQGAEVDPRSDVYSLGVVLYEMVTGAPPFTGDNPVAIAYKHVREQPPTPRDRNSAIPVTFEAIILQAMAKSTADRYASAEELRADLLRFRQGRGVMARPPVVADPTRAVAATRVQTRYTDDGGGTVVVPAAATTTAAVAPDEDRMRRGNGVFIALLVIMLVALGVLGYLLGRQLGVFGTSDSTTKVAVPAVIGAPVADAEAQLKAANLVPRQQLEANDTTAQGAVFDTDPKPGTKVAKGSTVTLKVSTGAPTVQVPSVIGQNIDDATSALQSLQLVVSPQPQPDDKKQEGTVISTDPPAGASVPKGSTVKVVVSSGKAKVLVPDETGKKVNDALKDLQTAGLQAKVVRQSSDQPTDTVLSSSPDPGTQVEKGSVVTLTVSSGPAPTTTASTTTSTTVPESSTTASTTAKSTTTTASTTTTTAKATP